MYEFVTPLSHMETVLSGRYEIVRELGHGSRGTVYLAKDHQKNQTVALKLFQGDANSWADFQKELSLLSAIHDPSIAEVYECGFDAEHKNYFLTQEYFSGKPLSSFIGKLPFEEIVKITSAICRTLQSLHLKGVFHGDLKPNNILVKDGDIKLVDFGLAQQFRSRAGSGDGVGGTLPYMAPELFLEAPIDGRADLYSLGIVLYELMTGLPPFLANSIPEIAERHLFEVPVNPALQAKGIPLEFGFITLRLLSKNPEDRFEEANDVIRAINLRFDSHYELGPEREVLTPDRKQELAQKHASYLLLERAAQFFEKRNDPDAHRLLAEIHYRQGHWDQARTLLKGISGPRAALLGLQIALKQGRFEEVRQNAEAIEDALTDSQRGLLHNTLGTALYYLGDYGGSEESFRKAFHCYESAQDHAARSVLLNNIGNLRIHEGRLDEGMDLYHQSIALCKSRGDVVNEGLFLTNLGYAHHIHNKYDDALAAYRQGEALLEAIGYGAGAAKVKSNLANLLIAMGSLEKGEEKLREAEAIASENHDHYLSAYCQLVTGDLYSKQGKTEEALAAYRLGKKLFHELGSQNEEETADRNITELLTKKEAPVTSDIQPSFLKRVLTINRQISLLQDVSKILETIIDSMIEFTGAERGFLILKRGASAEVTLARGMEGDAFSNSLVEQVLKTGEPIVTVDALTDERFSLSMSVHNLKLRSVVCIPLRVRDDIIGAIYLDNRSHCGVFSESVKELWLALADQAAIAIANASELEATKQSLLMTQSALELKYRYDEIIGRSPKMVEVLQILDRVTDSAVPVFLMGESGTGKELIARAIHFNGPRAKGPFIAVNCSAIPETLLESELFGYQRGAFTGAVRDRAGFFAMANGGTLFLDEISNMSLMMQAKLLRVLEDGVIQRIGSEKPLKVDFRLISAANRDLKPLIQDGKFREDLFFRIHAVRIELPPLRERQEDLPFLIDYFLAKFSKERGVERKQLSRSALERLSSYSWPGNVRELENVISSACLLSGGQALEAGDFQQLYASATPPVNSEVTASFRETMHGFEKNVISQALNSAGGNVSLAARQLKMARPQLARMLKKYGMR